MKKHEKYFIFKKGEGLTISFENVSVTGVKGFDVQYKTYSQILEKKFVWWVYNKKRRGGREEGKENA